MNHREIQTALDHTLYALNESFPGEVFELRRPASYWSITKRGPEPIQVIHIPKPLNERLTNFQFVIPAMFFRDHSLMGVAHGSIYRKDGRRNTTFHPRGVEYNNRMGYMIASSSGTVLRWIGQMAVATYAYQSGQQ